MKNLLRISVVLAALAPFPACAAPAGAAGQPLLNKVCVVSGEELAADAPTADYRGGKLGFCCEKCLAKWNKLDDAGKQAAFDAKVAR